MTEINFNGLKLIISNLSGIQVDEINADSALVEDLQLSSLKFVELMALIGEEYGVTIDEEQAMNVHTVGDLFHLLKTA